MKCSDMARTICLKLLCFVLLFAFIFSAIHAVNGDFVAKTVAVGLNPRAVVYDPGNNEIYVTNQGSGTVSVISGSSNTVVDTITVGSGPFWVVYDSGNNEIYVTNVTNVNSGTVSVLSDLAVAISPSSCSLDVRQSMTFAATATGGSGAYSGYQWYVNGSAENGQTASTFSYSPTSAGSASITVTVTDNSSITSPQSSAASVTVNSAPIVSIRPALWTMDVGQSQAFTATATGGSGTYTSYQWYVNGATQSGATSSTFTYAPTAQGTSSITVTVTDSLDATSPLSPSITVTVNAASPTPTPTPSHTPTPTPTATPTPTPTSKPAATETPSPTATPSSSSTPTPTSTPIPANTSASAVFGQYLPVILAVIILAAIIAGLFAKRRKTRKTALSS